MIDDAQLARRLLDLDLVERNRLKEGRQLQLTHGTTLYDALLRHRIVDERALVRLVAENLNIPSVVFAERGVDRALASMLPEEIAQRCRALPVQQTELDGTPQLMVAMEDPLDIMAMDEIASHLGRDIQPVLVGPFDLNAAIDLAYGEEKPTGIDFGKYASPSPPEAFVEDSWGAFFDDADSEEVPDEESAVISQEMRDRPSTMHLDDWDIEEVLDERDPVDMLNESNIAQPESGLLDLGEWELEEDEPQESAHAPPPPPIPAQEGALTFDSLLDEGAMPADGTYVANPSQSLTNLDDESSFLELDDEAISLEDPMTIKDAPSLGSEESENLFELAIAEIMGGKDEVPKPESVPAQKESELADLLAAKPAKTVKKTPEKKETNTLGKLKLKRIAVSRKSGAIIEKQSHIQEPGEPKATQPEPKAPQPAAAQPEPAEPAEPEVSAPAADDLLQGFQDVFDEIEEEAVQSEQPVQSEQAGVVKKAAPPQDEPMTREVALHELFDGAATNTVGQEETVAASEDMDELVMLSAKITGTTPDEESEAEEGSGEGSEEAPERSTRLRELLTRKPAPGKPQVKPGEHEESGGAAELIALDEFELDEQPSDAVDEGVAPAAEQGSEPGVMPSRETAVNDALTHEFLQRMRSETSKVARKRQNTTMSASLGSIPVDITDRQVLQSLVMLLVGKDLINFDEFVLLARSLPKGE